MSPPSDRVHWIYGVAFLTLGVFLLAQAIVGDEVWNRRAWRRYSWPGFGFVMGLFMWPVALLVGTTTLHLLAHLVWAQVMMLAGAAQLGLASERLRTRYWSLTMPLAFAVSGAAFLIHEPNSWLHSRASFVHHVCGWTLLIGALFPLGQTFRPRSSVLGTGFALTFVVLAVALLSARDNAPAFEGPHRAAVVAQHR